MNKINCCFFLFFSVCCLSLMSEELKDKKEIKTIENFEEEVPSEKDILKAYYQFLYDSKYVLSSGPSINIQDKYNLNYGVIMLAFKKVSENAKITDARLLKWLRAEKPSQRFLGFCIIKMRCNEKSMDLKGYTTEQLKLRKPNLKELEMITIKLATISDSKAVKK